MRPGTEAADLIASFPAAGSSGGTTLELLEKSAARRGQAYVALRNPASADALASGQWHAATVDELREAVARSSAGRVLLFGHCMGGFSALRVADGLADDLALSVRVLAVNTPCPGPAGEIPTMSGLSDGEIGEILGRDGFPQDVLDDEDMLAEIAGRLREDARVADRLAEWVAATGVVESLHVLSTRGDTFVRPAHCAGWWRRVTGDFQLAVADGGHAIDETSLPVLERAVESALAGGAVESALAGRAVESARAGRAEPA